MAIFEKRPGAPTGAITITTSQGTYIIDDSGNTTISVTDPLDINNLANHPFVRLQGGTGGAYVPPPLIEDVFLKDGILVRSHDQSPVAAVTIEHNGAPVTNPNFVDVTQNDLIALGASVGLVPTSIQTPASNTATAAPGDFIVYDVTTGSVVTSLPTAPQDKTRIAAILIGTSGANTATINAGGGDYFNKNGGSTSYVLSLTNQAVILQYNAASHSWLVQSNNLPLSALDARYAAAGSGGGGSSVDAWTAGTVAENMRRFSAINTAIAVTSGTIRLVGGATIPANKTAAHITVVSGATAGATLSNQWMALFKKSDGSLIGTTNDLTSGAWGANTAKTFDLATPYTPTSDTPVWIGLMVNAATTPSFVGANIPANVSGLSPVIAANTGTGLTTPATCPNSVATPAPGSGQTAIYAAIT